MSFNSWRARLRQTLGRRFLKGAQKKRLDMRRVFLLVAVTCLALGYQNCGKSSLNNFGSDPTAAAQSAAQSSTAPVAPGMCADDNVGLCYVSQSTKDNLDPNLSSPNIASGITIFGIQGTLPIAGSNACRDRGSVELPQTAETSIYGGSQLPGNYRDVPSITVDDDGLTWGNVTPVNRGAFVNCGATGTLVVRKQDCASKNGDNANWDGISNGNAGQGPWSLVSRTGSNLEVWQDNRTGLMWSSIVATADTWCKASGNAQSNDPSGYCGGNANSDCAEVLAAGIAGENWSGGSYASSKGAMGANSTPNVKWRLPTIYDYQQANINGIRFVMPDMGPNSPGYEWSATVSSASRNYAWLFLGQNGTSSPNSARNTAHAVRCVGR